MYEKLNIPKKIRAGFQERTSTYSGKLAYVTYYDSKGKMRKENSWNSWVDKNIDPQDYDNEPISGFVLNKDVGGSQRSWSWNARREKVRIYDPRNFEVEITVENLLFILQECSSIKGKGIEGELIYSWSGTQLVLLPVSSEMYSKSSEYNKLQVEKVTKKDMVLGCSYLTKDQVNVMYMGRHDFLKINSEFLEYECHNDESYYKPKKRHVFLRLDEDNEGYKRDKYILQTGFTKLAKKTSDNPLEIFADKYEELMSSYHVSKISKFVSTRIPISEIEFVLNSQMWGSLFVYTRISEEEYSSAKITTSGCCLLYEDVKIKNGYFVSKRTNRNRNSNHTYSFRKINGSRENYEFYKDSFFDVSVEFENGAKYNLTDWERKLKYFKEIQEKKNEQK